MKSTYSHNLIKPITMKKPMTLIHLFLYLDNEWKWCLFRTPDYIYSQKLLH